MDIQTFLELCIGQWFSQRSSYQFDTEKAESQKSELTVEWLEANHSTVVSLCQQYNLDPSQAIGGKKISWNSSTDYGQKNQTGNATIILIPDSNQPKIGKIIQTFQSQTSSQGSYLLAEDEALNLTLEVGDFLMEERIWFASENLRLRTSLIKGNNGYSRTAFYSEIRRLPPQQAA